MLLVLFSSTVVFFPFFLSLRSNIQKPYLTSLVVIIIHFHIMSGEHNLIPLCTTDKSYYQELNEYCSTDFDSKFQVLMPSDFAWALLAHRKTSPIQIHSVVKLPYTKEALNTLHLNSLCRTGSVLQNRSNFNVTEKICPFLCNQSNLFFLLSQHLIHLHSCHIKPCLRNSI